MAARNQRVELYAGDTKRIRIKLVDEKGTAIVFADPSAIWSVRPSARSTTKLIERAAIGSNFFFEQVDGVTYLVIQLNEDDTINVAPGAYYHEATIFEGPTRYTTLTGPFDIIPAANRRATP